MGEKSIVCPNCGFEQPPGIECQNCGIIFAKFKGHKKKHEKKIVVSTDNDEKFKKPISIFSRTLRLITGIGFLLLSIILLLGGILEKHFQGFFVFVLISIIGLYFIFSFFDKKITYNRHHLELSITVLLLITVRLLVPSAFKIKTEHPKKNKVPIVKIFLKQCEQSVFKINEMVTKGEYLKLEKSIEKICQRVQNLFNKLNKEDKIKLYKFTSLIKMLKKVALDGKKWETKKVNRIKELLKQLQDEKKYVESFYQ